MKIELGQEFPGYFQPLYPEEFELFSHFETAAGIPTALFAVTTWKANGKPNVCFHAWGSFHGDKTAFFAVMGNLYQHTHTYANIQREQCFCINFLPLCCYDALADTIRCNGYAEDEFAAGGFSLSCAKTIHAPAIDEAFLNIECTLKDVQDLSGAGITAMIVGQVQHFRGEGLCTGLCKAVWAGRVHASYPRPAGPCHRPAAAICCCNAQYSEIRLKGRPWGLPFLPSAAYTAPGAGPGPFIITKFVSATPARSTCWRLHTR